MPACQASSFVSLAAAAATTVTTLIYEDSSASVNRSFAVTSSPPSATANSISKLSLFSESTNVSPTMTLTETLAKLKSLSNEKVRIHNKKYGAGENQYGVKLGDIRKLASTIKKDGSLAKALWETGNVDAQLLATQIIDVKALSAEELDQMVRSGRFSQVADWLNAYVVKEHPDNEKLREEWMNSDDSWAVRAGWSLTAGRVARKAEGLDLSFLLDRIEAEMPGAAPEAQWTMNTTLAQIGINHPAYRERAIAIGERLGIYRDFPVSKGCTSPFAPLWINEMVKRQAVLH